MALISCPECGKKFSDKALACPVCCCPIEEIRHVTLSATSSIDSEQNKPALTEKKHILREYLENIRKLETDIYTISETISNLSPQFKELPSKNVITMPAAPKEPINFPTDASPVKKALKEAWRWIRFGEGFFLRIWDAITFGIKEAIDTAKLNRCNAKRNHDAKEKYDTDINNYHEVVLPEYEKKLEEEEKSHKNELARITLYNQGIEKNIALLEDEKAKTKAALTRLYDSGIIYPKYQGLVPVTTFCEYMDSGRRTALEGINGMYDLYESELLGQKIVSELSKVNNTLSYISYQIGGIASQLTGIARNQILLYEEVAKSNDIAKRIAQDTSLLLEHSASAVNMMSNLNEKIASIEMSTEMSAYNSEIAANRLDALSKIDEYEFSLRIV